MRPSQVGFARPVPVTVCPDALVRLTHLAVAAGSATLQHYGPGVMVHRKADASPVTAADHASHAVIIEGLHHWDPTVPVISKEGHIPPWEERSRWERFWLVDPLDGTKEFIQQNGEFTVNIALIEQGEPVMGVIYAPALDLLYYGGKGLGSWKRESRGAPEQIFSRPPATGAALRVAESRSHPSAELEEFLKTVSVAERVPAGSSLKFCWVAEGRADIYPRLGHTMEWDVAAGDCIFRNSGIGRQRTSTLVYNQPDLRNPGFVLGMADHGTSRGGGMVLWFTGLSGSGKSTIATRVRDELTRHSVPVEYLDGDVIRDIFPGTGFTRPERDAHIRRVGWMASRLESHGVVVIASLVSPYRESRNFVRSVCRDFREIWISTPFEECARRDVKGLYAKAKAGAVKNFTGLDDPYEPPERAELVMDTTEMEIEDAVGRVMGLVGGRELRGPVIPSAARDP